MRLSVAVLITLVARFAEAQDLGQLGPVYPIAEQSLLEQIRERLLAKERTGELSALSQRMIQQSRDRIIHPSPVSGLLTSDSTRTHYVDLTFTLQRNISDAQGRLLFPAGTRTNPLDVVGLSRRLLFFDARDPRQLNLAASLLAERPAKTRPVLVGGSYLDLMKAWKIPVYFDQQGILVKRFGIRQVPALVYQEGRRLRVDELGVQP
ncbi:type-F conjugative transfer system protein TraW [Massilia arenosa]|uniref:Type-F conjugative transfer system protein TraW n=1 Tax=Zemynaea arenosa TaxID=2561931 RepID=A0A4Y9S0C8_9BURK|nr:type-F conjugative transfer system protein TraW [Massilia arenosa]TFW13389.1 type-F conjugative transfer system protein TraW [Massilia arenosa]